MCDADVLKKLQVQFLTAAARWTNYGTEIEGVSVGLPNLVCLLLSMGYAIRRIDSVSPDQASPLRNNQKGTRVVVSCNHSCQRFFLELPEEVDQCKCLVKSDQNSQDSFWEVTATNSTSKNSSLIETGSGAVPAVSKELSTLIKNILICLTHMIQGTLEDVEDSLGRSVTSLNSNTSKGATSSPKKDAKRLSGFMKELVEPPIIISSPNGRHSQPIYRSLDTLTKSTDEIIPPPGLLTPKLPRVRESNLTQSSPNINLFTKQEAVNSSGSTISDSQNEKVIQLLKKAISMLQTNKSQEVSPAIVSKEEAVDKKTASDLKEADNIRAKSVCIPSLLKKIKSNSTSKIATTPVENGKPGKPGSLKLPVKSNKVAIKAKSPMPSGSNKISNDTRIICSKPRKVTNLYAHIKSTIPKASPTGNFVSKKT